MTAHEFRSRIQALGVTRASAAVMLRTSERTLYGWLAGSSPIPDLAVVILDLLRQGRIAPIDLGVERLRKRAPRRLSLRTGRSRT
jgi:hypothetical protein